LLREAQDKAVAVAKQAEQLQATKEIKRRLNEISMKLQRS